MDKTSTELVFVFCGEGLQRNHRTKFGYLDIQASYKTITIALLLLLGCDGSRSKTKRFTPCKIDGHRYDKIFVIADGIH